MVQNTSLSFPDELLKSLFELYIDLVTIFSDADQHSTFAMNSGKIVSGPQPEEIQHLIMYSQIHELIAAGLSGLNSLP